MEAYEVAVVYAGLGEKDQAFEWLERAYKLHDNDMWVLKGDRPLDPCVPTRAFRTSFAA